MLPGRIGTTTGGGRVEELAQDRMALNVRWAPPARAQALARVQALPPHLCTVCGEQAAAVRAVAFPDAGPRWVDLCWDHGMAARRRSRLPAALDGIGEDLRAAAR